MKEANPAGQGKVGRLPRRDLLSGLGSFLRPGDSPSVMSPDTTDQDEPPRMSRRRFLQVVGYVIGGIVASGFDNPSQVNATVDSLSAETLQGPEFTWDRTSVTPEWLRANPQLVMSIHDMENENGEVTRQYALMSDGRIVESHYDAQTKQMSEYALVLEKKPAMERPTQLYVFSDGTMVVGGEKAARSGQTGLELWDPIKKEWKNIEVPNGVGVVRHFIPIPGTNKFLINLGHPEQEPIKMHLATVDIMNRDMTVQPTNINGKSANALNMMSVDTTKKEFTMYTGGSYTFGDGLLVYTINYETGEGKVETLFPELGSLYGMDNFIDPTTGDPMVIASNAVDGKLSYINMKTRKVEQTIDVNNLFNNRGIVDHIPGSCNIRSVRIFKDGSNKYKVAIGGSYNSTLDGSERAAFGMYEYGTNPYRTLVFNAPEAGFPKFSQIQGQEDMKVITLPNKEVVVDARVRSFGKMVWDFTKNNVIRTVRGMNNTQLSSPQSTRLLFSAFIPAAAK